MTIHSEGVNATKNFDSQQQKYIDKWWLDTGHNWSQKDAIDAAFSLGIKFGFAQMKRRGQI